LHEGIFYFPKAVESRGRTVILVMLVMLGGRIGVAAGAWSFSELPALAKGPAEVWSSRSEACAVHTGDSCAQLARHLTSQYTTHVPRKTAKVK
jgi:hypothetical protein